MPRRPPVAPVLLNIAHTGLVAGKGDAAQDAHLFWAEHLGACHKCLVTHDVWRKMVKMLTCAQQGVIILPPPG